MTLINKVCIITGGSGFIGVNLAKKLVNLGNVVVIGDNFSLGSKKYVDLWISPNFDNFLEVDVSSFDGAMSLFEFCFERHGRIDEIWHLAANSDIPAGVDDSFVDLKDTFMTTFCLLEACRMFGVKKFNFASSSAVYGDWSGIPLHESLGPLKPISNYGAMKLASEAQICAAFESYLDVANIFRFPNVVGVPATHGVILDFFKKLIATPERLDILGDGSQKKSYLHVSELINAMVFISTLENETDSARIVNVGCDDAGILVSDIARIVTSVYSPNAKLKFGKTNRGWTGDVPKFCYDISYLKSLGWEPKLTSHEAVQKAAFEINNQLDLGVRLEKPNR